MILGFHSGIGVRQGILDNFGKQAFLLSSYGLHHIGKEIFGPQVWAYVSDGSHRSLQEQPGCVPEIYFNEHCVYMLRSSSIIIQ